MILFMLLSLFSSKINKLLIRLVRPSCRGNQLSLPPRSALQRWLSSSLGAEYFPLITQVVLPPSNVQQSISSHRLSVSNIFPCHRNERLNIMELKAQWEHLSNQIHNRSLSSPCHSTEFALEVLTVDHQVRRTALSSEDFLQAQQVPGFQKNQHEAIRWAPGWFAVARKIHLVIMVSPFWLLYLL